MLGLGVLEAFLIWWRRWVQNAAVLSVETSMRHDLYQRLQELPMSFHSRWQSGQLLSRATTDMSAIRRFSGFGMLFLLNITQLVVTTLVLLRIVAGRWVWLWGGVGGPDHLAEPSGFESRYVVVSRRARTSKATSRPGSRKPPSGSG